MPQITNVTIWRDLMPGPNRGKSNLSVSVDATDCRPTKIRLVFNDTKWVSKLNFRYKLRSRREGRYGAHGGPSWPVGSNVRVFVQINDKWTYVGIYNIGATH